MTYVAGHISRSHGPTFTIITPLHVPTRLNTRERERERERERNERSENGDEASAVAVGWLKIIIIGTRISN